MAFLLQFSFLKICYKNICVKFLTYLHYILNFSCSLLWINIILAPHLLSISRNSLDNELFNFVCVIIFFFFKEHATVKQYIQISNQSENFSKKVKGKRLINRKFKNLNNFKLHWSLNVCVYDRLSLFCSHFYQLQTSRRYIHLKKTRLILFFF